ncbi:ABC transporter permease subunit [Aliagarivorans marinus]|uniref:ABC transporter permease subunit n=1 Tax=Aliagarivorans marinus TaxID=561965 RepID=UPI000401D727|nr:ABC transporter permease subunit [Aliagarivorans marinus]
MPYAKIFTEDITPSNAQKVLLRFQKNTFAVIGFWVLALFLVITLFAPFIAPYALEFQGQSLFQPPSWHSSGSVDHFLGTDGLGRDILSRLIYGVQLTVGGATFVTLIAVVIGLPLGIFSGMSQGIKASVLHHLMDTALSIPTLLIAIMIVAYLGPGLGNTLIAITLAQIPQFIRFTYIAVSSEMQKEYVTAVRLDGATNLRILRYGVLPNISDSIVMQLTRCYTNAILYITAMGFIGIGAQAPLPELGAMIGQSRDLLFVAPWTISLPGLTIMLCTLSVNVVSDGVRKALSEGVD